jgi:hypothetical protein
MRVSGNGFVAVHKSVSGLAIPATDGRVNPVMLQIQVVRDTRCDSQGRPRIVGLECALQQESLRPSKGREWT